MYEGGEEEYEGSGKERSEGGSEEGYAGGEVEFVEEENIPEVDHNHIFMVQVNSNFNLPVFEINYSKEKKNIANIGQIKESAFRNYGGEEINMEFEEANPPSEFQDGYDR
jgi:hypothetical protein